jgi:outer membrane phospholipase A
LDGIDGFRNFVKQIKIFVCQQNFFIGWSHRIPPGGDQNGDQHKSLSWGKLSTKLTLVKGNYQAALQSWSRKFMLDSRPKVFEILKDLTIGQIFLILFFIPTGQ